MRIAFLTLEYPPSGGGIASSLATVAPALAARGHEVRVVGWSDRAQRGNDRGVTVELDARTRLPKVGWWLNPRRVERTLSDAVERGDLDVVVAHDWCGPSARVAPGCPVLIWCNGSATYFSALTGEGLSHRVSRAEARAVQQAASVAAASRYTAVQTQSLFGLRECPTVVHNPVDTERFRPGDRAAVSADTFLYVGTIVRKKGVLDLCRAFDRVVARRPEAKLILAGRDSRDAATGAASTWDLCREVMSEDTWSRVDYRGFVPYREIEKLIRTCLAAVLPSYAEALPLAWMEVMACGRPVIAADVGWAPELISTGHDGLLVQANNDVMLAEAMLRLLDDPSEADTLGGAARSRMVSSFSPEVVVDSFETWLHAAIGAGSSPSAADE